MRKLSAILIILLGFTMIQANGLPIIPESEVFITHYEHFEEVAQQLDLEPNIDGCEQVVSMINQEITGIPVCYSYDLEQYPTFFDIAGSWEFYSGWFDVMTYQSFPLGRWEVNDADQSVFTCFEITGNPDEHYMIYIVGTNIIAVSHGG